MGALSVTQCYIINRDDYTEEVRSLWRQTHTCMHIWFSCEEELPEPNAVVMAMF